MVFTNKAPLRKSCFVTEPFAGTGSLEIEPVVVYVLLPRVAVQVIVAGVIDSGKTEGSKGSK